MQQHTKIKELATTQETAEALKDLDRQYEHFTKTVWKASKQLLKFDEINRLVTYEVEEKAATASGSSKSSYLP